MIAIDLLVLFAAAAVALLPSRSEWQRVRPWGSGSWQESWTVGTVPLALQPVVGPDDKLWMIGGRGVWRSANGTDWERVASKLPWGDRYGAATVSFRGKLWVIGGEERPAMKNDVFHSRDGSTWTRAATPPWSARRSHSVAVFRDRLWIIGGSDSVERDDVWESSDGQTWRRAVEHAPWGRRADNATIVWKNQLCILGRGPVSRPAAEIWCSPNGQSWTQLAANPGWEPRRGPGLAVFNERILLFGGSSDARVGDDCWLNDVWSSSDGKTWTREPDAPWSRRSAQYSAVFKNRLWIFGGKGIEAGGRGGFADDVWVRH
jgi:hypothetical protein